MEKILLSLDNYFKITKRGSNFKTETIAGITIFLSMSYILAVMPYTFLDIGMDSGAVFTATALSAAFATLLMGLVAKYPIALAPGMGMQAFFAYTIVLEMGYSWEEALFAIFVSGILFLLLSLSGFRKKIINVIPNSIKHSVTIGIGFFIAFIGMQGAGIIVSQDSTLVTLGQFSSPVTALALIGTIITLILIVKKVNLAIFIGMISTIVIGIFFQLFGIDVGMQTPSNVVSMPSSISPIFGKLFDVNMLALLLDFKFWILVLSVLFVDFFDTAGTILAVGNEAGTVDEEGNIQDGSKILLVDSIGTISGAVLGVSSVTSYIESLTGIRLGARTGFSSVVVAICFLMSLFLSPWLSLITSAVTAPALITIGALMVMNNAKIDYSDLISAISSFVTVSIMVLSYSISNGLAAGIITYVILKVASKEAKDIHPLMYGLAVLFLIYFII